MESEKVKEIKKALKCIAIQNAPKIEYKGDLFADILNLITELEKENEILKGTKDRLTFAERIEIVNNAVEIKLKQCGERLIEKLKDNVNGGNCDMFIECKKLVEETFKDSK